MTLQWKRNCKLTIQLDQNEPKALDLSEFKITFKKVILVKTSETEVVVENQKNPADTAGGTDAGAVQAKPVNESMLSKIKTSLFG